MAALISSWYKTLQNSAPFHNAHSKHEYKMEMGGSREHNSRGTAVFCLPHFVYNLCYLLVRSGAEKYLSPADNPKKSDMDTKRLKKKEFLGIKKKQKKKQTLEMLGFEPRTFCMQSRRSTTELHPLSCCSAHCYIHELSVKATE